MSGQTVNFNKLVTENLDIWSSTIKAKSATGRGSNSKRELYGVKKLRELILELAIRGLLVPQDMNDDPAVNFLKEVANIKSRLVSNGKIIKSKPLAQIAKKDEPYILPQNWAWTRLGDLVEMYNGRAFKSSEWTDKGLPIVRIQNLNDKSAAFNYFDGDIAEHNKINNGSFLISWSGTPGTSFGAFIWNRGEAALNQHINNCIFHSHATNLEFMRLAVNGCMNHLILHAQGGVGLKHVTKGTLNNTIIGFPPQEEQHRIVTKVNELMALCDQLEQQQKSSISAHETLVETLLGTLVNAADNSAFDEAWRDTSEYFDILFTTEHSIDQLKQTILQLAVMGKLVPQNRGDEPASLLLKKIAEEKADLINEKKIKKQKALPPIGNPERPFKLPEGWKWCRVSQIIENTREISYGIIKLEAEPISGGIPTLRCSDVKPGYIDTSGIRTVAPSVEAPYKRTRLKGGEVLINIRGTLGGAALVTKELANYNIAREVAMLPIHEEIEAAYIVLLVLSPLFWNMIEANLKGTAYKGLNLGLLSEFVIPLPPRKEQSRILSKANQLITLSDQLKKKLNNEKTTKLNLTEAIVEGAIA